jgi:hypothetical protein
MASLETKQKSLTLYFVWVYCNWWRTVTVELEYNHAHVEVQPYNAVLDLHATVHKLYDDLIIQINICTHALTLIVSYTVLLFQQQLGFEKPCIL